MRQMGMQLPRILGLLSVLVLVGCGDDYHPAPLPTTPPPQPAAAPTPPPAPAPAPMVVEKADVGVGAKGRDYEAGLVTTPVAQYFAAREAMVFRIQVPEAMKLYKAEHGKGPQSLEEFVNVLKANKIKLPELPEGHQYAYDPQSEELKVIHPKK